MKTATTTTFDRFEVARTLTEKQRWAFWTLGSEIRNRFLSDNGFVQDENRSHEKAFAYLHSANWNLKTAKALLTANRAWTR